MILTPKVDDNKLHALIRMAVREELDSKQCTLWMDWELTREDRKKLAVTWMTREFERILRRLNERPDSLPSDGINQ